MEVHAGKERDEARQEKDRVFVCVNMQKEGRPSLKRQG